MNPTAIPYLTHTWNPITGCTKCSPACDNCWAEKTANRWAGRVGYPKDEPFRPTLHEERLDEPLALRKSARIGVCFMGDLFHEDLAGGEIASVFATMAKAHWHTFVVLTKRPVRLREWVGQLPGKKWPGGDPIGWPLPNVWLGTTVWNQESADNNIPPLLATPAALRWVSYEPALGPVDFSRVTVEDHQGEAAQAWPLHGKHRVDWVVCGGESGPGARPMHPDWARTVRDQCKAAGVPFWFKQWGEWAPNCLCGKAKPCKDTPRPATGPKGCMFRCGTKAAGNRLYGEVIEQLPEASRA